jgi:hypothetical protein
MGSTDLPRTLALLGHMHGLATWPMVSAPGTNSPGAVAIRSIGGTTRVLPRSVTSILSGLSPTSIADAITKALLAGLFHSLLGWVAGGASSLVGVLGDALSSTTQPVLTGSAFSSEFELMAALSAAVALPFVAVAAIQAIIRQEPGSLLKSVLVRLPLALLFTGVSVQFVALGLVATDQASALLIGAAGDPTRRMLSGLVTALAQPGGFGLAAFGGFLVVLSASVVAFVLWLELAVRSAAIAAAALFLPLALVGLAWPATSHWARRLGETLAALVLSKLVIAAVLALAAGLLVSPSGVAGVVEGVALLAVAAFAPFALLKLVPMIEAGAVGHLEGLGRRPVQAAERLGRELGLEGGGVAALAGLGGLMAHRVEGLGSSTQPTGGVSEGPWTPDRPTYGGSGGGQAGSAVRGPARPAGPPASAGHAAPSGPSGSAASPESEGGSVASFPLPGGVTGPTSAEGPVGTSVFRRTGSAVSPVPPPTSSEQLGGAKPAGAFAPVGSQTLPGSNGSLDIARSGLQAEQSEPDDG